MSTDTAEDDMRGELRRLLLDNRHASAEGRLIIAIAWCAESPEDMREMLNSGGYCSPGCIIGGHIAPERCGK